MDQEYVEMQSRRNLELSMDREYVEMLSRRQRAQEKFLMDREVVKVFVEAGKESLIEMNLSRIHREAVEFEENEFSRKENT